MSIFFSQMSGSAVCGIRDRRILNVLIGWDAVTFLYWAALYVWFLSVDPSDVVYEVYRNQHTALLVHVGTTWQLLWMRDSRLRTSDGHTQWRAGVRTIIFLFTLVLDSFIITRTIRFVPRDMHQAAWACQISVSAAFLLSDVCAFALLGLRHLGDSKRRAT